ncbi:hypothetical protein JCM10207_001385 [Rhodosporidiobolus poonsookiae]
MSSSGFTFDSAHRDLIRDDLEWRVAFGRDFIGFTEEDGQTLNSVAKVVTPLVNPIVDAVYIHLFNFPYTKAFFLKRNVGFEGSHASTVDSLGLNDDMINFRKTFLRTYVAKIFTSDYEKPQTWEYFDKVSKMHTGLAGFKHRANKDPLVVDLQPMALLLGWVEDVVIQAVMELPDETADAAAKTAVLRAFNKFMWLQNDSFNRYYAKTDEELAAATAKAKEEGDI